MKVTKYFFLGIAVFSFFSTVMPQIDFVGYFHSLNFLMKLFDQTNNCDFYDEFLNSVRYFILIHHRGPDTTCSHYIGE
jgi:hypothetical protein